MAKAELNAILKERIEVAPGLGMFRISPDGKKMTLVIDEIVYPNGLCFSPDEKLLYVNCSRERLIRVYDVKPDGSVSGKGRLFYQYGGPERGVPDGMKCDIEGNVYCTGPGGIWVFDAGGKRLGIIEFPEQSVNFAFGGADLKTLFCCAHTSVYTLRVKAPGNPHPWYRLRK